MRDELLAKYEVFLLDAFGVLVNSVGVLPGARELIEAIGSAGKRFIIVTNDASRLPESAAKRYADLGLPVTVEHIQSSGMLLVEHFERSGLVGANCLALGPPDSHEYVRRAGGVICEPRDDGDYGAVVCCDDAGYPFLGTLDATLSALFRLFDAGMQPALVLPNPDIIYPKGESSYGFTAGGAAMLLEEALRRRYPDNPPRFVRLGKPAPTLFRSALKDSDPRTALMIGDQLETDIAGAHAAEIDSVLVESGVSAKAKGIEPTYRVGSIADLL